MRWRNVRQPRAEKLAVAALDSEINHLGTRVNKVGDIVYEIAWW